MQRTQDADDLDLAKQLLAFGDYLGNGNMFCFHRERREVYYFDHDSGEALTHMFDRVEDYLDALMILCLAEVYGDDDAVEALLTQCFGKQALQKW